MSKILRFLAPALAVGLAAVVALTLQVLLLWVLPDAVKASHAARETITTVLVLLIWLPLAVLLWVFFHNGASPRTAWRQVTAFVDRFF